MQLSSTGEQARYTKTDERGRTATVIMDILADPFSGRWQIVAIDLEMFDTLMSRAGYARGL